MPRSQLRSGVILPDTNFMGFRIGRECRYQVGFWLARQSILIKGSTPASNRSLLALLSQSETLLLESPLS